MTWLGWCNEYLQCAIEKGDCKKMIQHKSIVRKHIAADLKQTKRTDILLKEVDRDMVSDLFGYMREYLNPRQIKSDSGRVETLSCRRDSDASGANRTKGFRLLLHDGASAWEYAATTLELHQGYWRFHRPAKDRATRNRSTQRVIHIPVAAPTGERGRHYNLRIGEEARQRGEICAAHQGKGRGRKGFHLPQ